ncbi:hypothetical protein ILUMI_24169 [Ignelater luminosus]|uniref:Gag-like protein n=1 Tax=Ignelater luminosus TaxID=2038154 RepID=A0A8K0CCG4_IGNLU|nr:hypothetical protein ILUMI_24169 [Ignelater luminosus]
MLTTTGKTMSSPGGLQDEEELDASVAEGSSDQNEGTLRDLELYDGDIPDSNSSTGSNSSTLLGRMKSLIDLPAKRMKASTKKCKHHPYRMPSSKRRCKGIPRGKPVKFLSNCDKYHVVNPKTLEITSESSTEHVPNDYYKIKDVGNVNSQEPFVCSIYITSYNTLEDQLNMPVTIDPFADTLNNIASGKIRLQKTFCGIIVAFTKEDDADKVMKLPLQNIFSGPVQVARFQTGEYRFRQNVIIKDVPWCISNIEIHHALKRQGIMAGRIMRTRAHIKIEVLNALDMHRLIEEGLNFFNYTSFSAVPENSVTQGEPDIIQCFKCQGFWHTSTHCRQMPRCVRCGDNHDVEYCPRPRNAPICCHCGGPHHAAYKMCPVRLQHINSTYVGFQLAKTKPTGSFAHNVF